MPLVEIFTPWSFPIMGGERETKIDQAPAKGQPDQLVGKIRIHESSGEVHLHDDARKLKVAIPSATWYDTVSKLMERNEPWTFFDQKNSSVAYVAIKIKKAKPGKRDKAVVDMKIRIDAADLSPTAKSLIDFTLKG